MGTTDTLDIRTKLDCLNCKGFCRGPSIQDLSPDELKRARNLRRICSRQTGGFRPTATQLNQRSKKKKRLNKTSRRLTDLTYRMPLVEPPEMTGRNLASSSS